VRHDSIRTRSRARAERTEEGEIGSNGYPGRGEERRGHDHWRGPEAKREGVARGALRRENGGGGEQGVAASSDALFKRRSEEQRKGGPGSVA
jgi:hypothetical protein